MTDSNNWLDHMGRASTEVKTSPTWDLGSPVTQVVVPQEDTKPCPFTTAHRISGIVTDVIRTLRNARIALGTDTANIPDNEMIKLIVTSITPSHVAIELRDIICSHVTSQLHADDALLLHATYKPG